MPELPDVELFTRYLRRTALHRRVEDVSFDPRAKRMLQGLSEATLKRRLRGHVLDRARRHGKLLFAGLANGEGRGKSRGKGAGALVLHFGMTGFLKYYKRPESAPEHARLVLGLDDGYHLAYDCQRLFGEIAFTGDPDAWIEEHELGPDALALGAKAFAERLSGRRGSVKAALMNQSLLAGIGNVYSDEILFRARLHPETPVAHLDEKALRALHGALRQILKDAIRHRADPDRMPRTWLLPHREKGAKCPRCGSKLERHTVGQRSSWMCPKCQEKR